MHPFTAVEGNCREVHTTLPLRKQKTAEVLMPLSSPPEPGIEHSVPVMLAEIV